MRSCLFPLLLLFIPLAPDGISGLCAKSKARYLSAHIKYWEGKGWGLLAISQLNGPNGLQVCSMESLELLSATHCLLRGEQWSLYAGQRSLRNEQ